MPLPWTRPLKLCMMAWPETIVVTRANEREREIFMVDGNVLDYGDTQLRILWLFCSHLQELITLFSSALGK